MKDDNTSEKNVSLLPLSQEEITMIKKFIVSGGKLEKGQKLVPFLQKNAVQVGKQFVLSVPPSLAEELKRNYIEALTHQETSNEEGESE